MESRYADLNITALPVSTTHNESLVSNDTASTTTPLTIQNGNLSAQGNYANNNNTHHLNNNHISSNGSGGGGSVDGIKSEDQASPNNSKIDDKNSSG